MRVTFFRYPQNLLEQSGLESCVDDAIASHVAQGIPLPGRQAFRRGSSRSGSGIPSATAYWRFRARPCSHGGNQRRIYETRSSMHVRVCSIAWRSVTNAHRRHSTHRDGLDKTLAWGRRRASLAMALSVHRSPDAFGSTCVGGSDRRGLATLGARLWASTPMQVGCDRFRNAPTDLACTFFGPWLARLGRTRQAAGHG